MRIRWIKPDRVRTLKLPQRDADRTELEPDWEQGSKRLLSQSRFFSALGASNFCKANANCGGVRLSTSP
jgi:hypothetical protein